MAIERTELYSSMDSLCNWLMANALGTYFDEVEKQSGRINCKYGGETFIAFTDTLYSSNYGIEITTPNGLDTTLYDSDLKNTGYAYGWKTNSGLALAFQKDNGHCTTPCFFITKDNHGETAVVYDRNLSFSSVYNVVAETQKCNSLGKYIQINTAKSSMTSLCPDVVLAATDSFTPNVFLTPYTQYSGEAILEINGAEYLSNGAFVLKD